MAISKVTRARRARDKATKVLQWWLQDDETEMASDIFDTVSFINTEQSERMDRNLRCMRLYGNVDYAGLGPYSYNRSQTPTLPENRVKYNVVSQGVDTVSAKISKMRPRMSFLTSGGDFSLQEQAKKLTKYILGAFKINDIYRMHQDMFRDGAICDIGAIKHFRDGSRIVSERVLPGELYVETADGMYGNPQCLYQVKYIYKNDLIREYPDKAVIIKSSSSTLDPINNGGQAYIEEEGDYVLVVESWRLPSGHKKKDGLHVLSCEAGLLYKEKYKRDYFPFTFSRWSKPQIGFFGQSLADRLTGNQIEINKMLRIIQRSFHLGSAFKVFLEYGSKVAKEHINNEIGSIVYYAGAKPEFYTPQTVHPEFFRHLEWLIRSSMEEAGISQLSATSRVPAGIDGASGKAIREYNDLETERFVLTAQEYENTFAITAKQYIDLSKEISAAGGDFEVIAESKRFLESIKWSDINFTENEYMLQMFPTSMLPSDPAGLMATIQEWVNAGWIDKVYGMRLLDFPDLEGYVSLQTAALDDLFHTADLMLYKGEPQTPEPFQDLAQGIKLFQSIYLWAKRNGAPEDRLELLRNWMTQADAMTMMARNAQNVQQQLPMEANPVPQGGAQLPPQLPAPMSMGAAPMAA